MSAIKAAFWWSLFMCLAGLVVGLIGANVDDISLVAFACGMLVSGGVTLTLVAMGLERR